MMMRSGKITRILTMGLLSVVLFFLMVGCGALQEGAETGDDSDSLVQLSTITALVAGDYYGSLKVSELMEYGDFGLGCFDAVNGEMIILDGVCYQALGDGTVKVADENETVPFATLCSFENDFSKDTGKISDIEALTDVLNSAVNENGANSMYAVKIHTVFPAIHVRSETKQEEPYVPLDQALKVSQTEFDYSDVSGTLICLYFPDYMSKLNSAGWHFHFISDDGTKGGHVLGVSFDEAEAEFDQALGFEMITPATESFQTAGIDAVDQSSIDAAERASDEGGTEFYDADGPIILEGAMDIETDYMIEQLESAVTSYLGPYLCVEGTYHGFPVVVLRTEQEGANAGASTALAIERFHPRAVINQGTSGGHDPDLHVYDIVIGTETEDYSAWKTGFAERGEGADYKDIEYLGVYSLNKRTGEFTEDTKIPADSKLFQAAVSEKDSYTEGKVVEGVISTSEEWNNQLDRVLYLHELTGSSCEEMESNAAAVICRNYNIPFLAIRVLSNTCIYNNEGYVPDTGVACQRFVLNVAERYMQR